MNKALWVVQIFLSLNFLVAAGLKLFAFDMMSAKSPDMADLHGLFIFIAICEIAGAVGLIAPRLTRIAVFLTAWAAAGLATISVLAGLFHLVRGEYAEIPPAVVFALLSFFVVWGRGFRPGTAWGRGWTAAKA